MKVVYKKFGLINILDAKYEAQKEGREIEYIVLSEHERDELALTWYRPDWKKHIDYNYEYAMVGGVELRYYSDVKYPLYVRYYA